MDSVSWGYGRLAQRGIISRCKRIYGYHINKDGSWIINHEEAERYIKILAGKSFREIIEDLHNEGIESLKGSES